MLAMKHLQKQWQFLFVLTAAGILVQLLPQCGSKAAFSQKWSMSLPMKRKWCSTKFYLTATVEHTRRSRCFLALLKNASIWWCACFIWCGCFLSSCNASQKSAKCSTVLFLNGNSIGQYFECSSEWKFKKMLRLLPTFRWWHQSPIAFVETNRAQANPTIDCHHMDWQEMMFCTDKHKWSHFWKDMDLQTLL